MTLFEECIEALGGECLIHSEESTREIASSFVDIFDVKDGQIAWKKMPTKRGFTFAIDILTDSDPLFDTEKCFILWDNARYTVVEAKLDNVLESIDDVICVATFTWLISTSLNSAIAFRHDRIRLARVY